MAAGAVQKIQFVDSPTGPIARWGQNTWAVLSDKACAKIGHVLVCRGPVRCRMLSRRDTETIVVTPVNKTWGSRRRPVWKPPTVWLPVGVIFDILEKGGQI